MNSKGLWQGRHQYVATEAWLPNSDRSAVWSPPQKGQGGWDGRPPGGSADPGEEESGSRASPVGSPEPSDHPRERRGGRPEGPKAESSMAPRRLLDEQGAVAVAARPLHHVLVGVP